jgi:hypothetical protein
MATFSASIAATNDDAQETGGTMLLSSTSLNAGATNQYIGLHFPNVTIPQGSTISTAVLTCYIVNTSYDDPDTTIYGDDADDSAALSSTSYDISSRTPTTATVAYSGSSLGAGFKDTPDIKTVIQEITDRSGWAGGNAMTLIFVGASAGSLYRIRPYENNSSQAASLAVTYTAPSSGGANRKLARIRLTTRVGGTLA